MAGTTKAGRRNSGPFCIRSSTMPGNNQCLRTDLRQAQQRAGVFCWNGPPSHDHAPDPDAAGLSGLVTDPSCPPRSPPPRTWPRNGSHLRAGQAPAHLTSPRRPGHLHRRGALDLEALSRASAASPTAGHRRRTVAEKTGDSEAERAHEQLLHQGPQSLARRGPSGVLIRVQSNPVLAAFRRGARLRRPRSSRQSIRGF